MQSRESLKRIWSEVRIWMVKYPQVAGLECLSIIHPKYKKSRPNDVVMSARNISIDFQANFPKPKPLILCNNNFIASNFRFTLTRRNYH